MKLKTMGLVLCGLFAITTLGGCKDNGTNNPGGNEPIPSSPIKSFVDANLDEEEDVEISTKKEVSHEIEELIPSELEVVDSQLIDKGVLIVKNKTDHVGVYSLINNSMLVECQYFQKWLKYDVIDNVAGGFIRLQYEDSDIVIDNHGNILFQRENTSPYPYGDNFYVYYSVVNDTLYISVHVGDNITFYYYENGKVNLVEEIPQPEIPDALPDPEPEKGYNVGDLFVEGYILDLGIFGKSGYYASCSETGYISIFKTGGEYISSFLVPKTDAIYVAKDTIYYQTSALLPEDAIDYDYSIENSKYALDTKGINVFNGEVKSYEFNYVIDEVDQYKDMEGYLNYAIFEAKQIGEHKTLEDKKDLLVTPGLQIAGDYSGISLDSFIKIEDVYYNTSTKILYDSNLKPVTYLSAMNPSIMKPHNLFIGTLHGKYGIVDLHGKVVIPFEYETILWSKNFNHILLQDGNDFELYNLSSKQTVKTFKDREISVINSESGVYALRGEKALDFAQLDGTTFDLNLTINENVSFMPIANIDALNENEAIIFLVNIDSNKRIVKFFFDKKDMTYNSFGTSKDIEELDGSSYETAIPLHIGENKIHQTYDYNHRPYEGAYVKLDNPKSGAYHFKFDNNVNVSYSEFIISYFDEDGHEHQTREYLNDDHSYILDSFYDYYLRLNFDGFRTFIVEYNGELKPFTGYTELMPTDTNKKVYKLLNLANPGSFALKASDNVSYNVYKMNAGVLYDANISSTIYDVGSVFGLSQGKYIFELYYARDNEGVTSTYSLKPYDYEDIVSMATNQEITFDLKNGQTAARSFTLSQDGDYVVKSNLDSVSLYLYDSKQSVTSSVYYKQYSTNVNVYHLRANKNYIVKVTNNNSSISSCTLSINKLSYLDLEEYALGDNVYAYTYMQNIYRIKPTSTQYAFFSGYSYQNYAPKIYKINSNNSYELCETMAINDHNSVYKFEKDCEYVLKAVAGSNDYQLTSHVLSLNSLVPLQNGGRNKTYFRLIVDNNGLYAFTTTRRLSSYKMYQPDDNGDYVILNPAEVTPDHIYYQLEANKQYALYTSEMSGYTYYCDFKYVASSINTLPSYEITTFGGFDSTSNVGEYRVGGTDTFMKIKMLDSGTFTMNVDLHIWGSGSTQLTIYRNDVRYKIYTRATKDTLNIPVEINDVIKIDYYYGSADHYAFISDMNLVANNQISIKATNIPLEYSNNATIYCWAWSNETDGKFYSGTFDNGTNTFSVNLPKTATNFLLVRVKSGFESPNWSNGSITHKTNDVIISNGVTSYNCYDNWVVQN